MGKANNRFISAFVLVLFLVPSSFVAQDLGETLSNLSSDAAQSYVQPITNGFGANLNSGWFAYPPDPVMLGLTIRARVVANGTFFSSDEETFETTGNFRYNSQQADELLANSGITPGSPGYNAAKAELLSKDWLVNFSGPTIIGSEDEYLRVRFDGGTVGGEEIQPYEQTVEEVYGYLDGLTIFPSANIQLTLGTVAGTNFVVRWFPSINIQDVGKFSFYGLGFVHNTNIWFKNPLPVDLSLGAFYQSLEVGDIFESSASQFGVYASKEIGGAIGVTPYIGLTYETSETSVAYTYKYDTPVGPESVNVEFDLDGDNDIGFTVGASFRLLIINLNVDYKAAKTGTITAGLSFGIL